MTPKTLTPLEKLSVDHDDLHRWETAEATPTIELPHFVIPPWDDNPPEPQHEEQQS